MSACQQTAASVPPSLLGGFNFPEFDLPTSSALTVAWTALSANFELWLSDHAGTQVAHAQGSDSHPNSSLTTGTLAAGRYFVTVANYNFNAFGGTLVSIVVTGPGCPAPAPASGGDPAVLVALVAGAGIAGAVLFGLSRRGHAPATTRKAGSARRRT